MPPYVSWSNTTYDFSNIRKTAASKPPCLPDSLPANRGFKIASLNVNSLIKHIDDLRIFLADNLVDVLAINESKLDDSIKNCELYIPGYEIIRSDRNRNGGGVCFYIKTSINFVTRRDLNLNDLENLCLEIQKPCSKPFLVVTWYRRHCSSAELFSQYETLVGKLDSLDLEYYLMGDLKCNMASAHFDTNTPLLCEISDTYGLRQLITEPTRIIESSSSLIDVIFKNCINSSTVQEFCLLTLVITASFMFIVNYLQSLLSKGI